MKTFQHRKRNKKHDILAKYDILAKHDILAKYKYTKFVK